MSAEQRLQMRLVEELAHKRQQVIEDTALNVANNVKNRLEEVAEKLTFSIFKTKYLKFSW